MDSLSLQQLLELEANLTKASNFQTNEGFDISNQTDLLLSHLDQITQQNDINSPIKLSSSSSSELPISTHTVTTEEIKDGFKRQGSFNITMNCSKCNESLFDNEIDAHDLSPKFGAKDCCLETLENHKNIELDPLALSFWCFFINNFSNCVLTLPNYTRFMFTKGVPASLRSIIWAKVLQIEISEYDYYERLYRSLNQDISSELKIIENDVNRSIPGLSQFMSESQKQKMVSVLNAFSIYETNIGYCQGLQFLASPFFTQFNDEIHCFKSLIQLFQVNHNLAGIYDHSMSGLNLWFFQFEQIFKEKLPTLSSHFSKLAIDLKMFLSQWFVSLFSVTIPVSFLPRLFDVVLMEGFQSTIFRTSLLLLQENEELLLSIDDDELIMKHLLSDMCWCVFHNNENKFIDDLMSMPVSKFTGDNMDHLKTTYQSNNSDSKTRKSIFGKFMSGLKSSASIESYSSRLRSSSVASSVSSVSTTSSSVSASSPPNKERCGSFASPPKMPPIVSRSSYRIDSSQSSIISHDDDYDLLSEMLKLCMKNGIEDPVLEKVKMRLDIIA